MFKKSQNTEPSPEYGLMPAQPQPNQYLPSTEFRESIPDVADEEVNLRDYLDVLVRRRWLILGILALAFISTAIFTLTMVPTYKATASVEVTAETPKVTKFEEVVEAEVKAREFYQTQVSLLNSKSMAERIMQKLDLAKHPVIVETLFKENDDSWLGRIKGALKSWIPTSEAAPIRSEISEEILDHQALLNYFQDNFGASIERDATLITLSFISPNRSLSRDVVNSLAEEFLNWKMEKKLDASHGPAVS